MTGAPLCLAATAATAGLFATGLDQDPSMVLGCALAAAFALGSALIAVPGLLVLIGARASEADGDVPGEPASAVPPAGSAASSPVIAGAPEPPSASRPC